MTDTEDSTRRRNAVTEYRKKLLQHKELESRVRSGSFFLNPTFTPLRFWIAFRICYEFTLFFIHDVVMLRLI